jgi:N-acetylglutamate synthase-like GNAT family acetyltransferase
MPGVILREGFDEMDFARVTEMLESMPWSLGISRAEVEKAARNSTVLVGAFEGERQIGFARALSDKTRFCYLMDVCVDPTCRHQGAGRAMIQRILDHPELGDVYQWMLFTTSAQDFYKNLGFNQTRKAENLMEIRRDRPAR